MENYTVTPPSTYAQWMSVIDKLKNRVDDEITLVAMQRGTIEWQTGVAERFSKKLIDALNYRLNTATDKFQKDMSRSRGQEANIVQALLSLRKELIFLSKSVDLPVIPENTTKSSFRIRQIRYRHPLRILQRRIDQENFPVL